MSIYDNPHEARTEVLRLFDLYGKAIERFRHKRDRGVKGANPAKANSIFSKAVGLRTYANMESEEFDRLCDEAVERWRYMAVSGEIDLTQAQQDFLDLVKEYAERGEGIAIHGQTVRIAERLQKKGLLRIRDVGEPWTRGWYREAYRKPRVS